MVVYQFRPFLTVVSLLGQDFTTALVVMDFPAMVCQGTVDSPDMATLSSNMGFSRAKVTQTRGNLTRDGDKECLRYSAARQVTAAALAACPPRKAAPIQVALRGTSWWKISHNS